MKFRNLLDDCYNLDAFELVKRKERIALIKIRQDANAYGYPPIKDRNIIKLAKLHIQFVKLAENKQTQDAYEKMEEYTKLFFEASELFHGFDKDIKEGLMEKFVLELELKVYDELDMNDCTLINDGIKDKHYEEQFKQAKRIEKLAVITLREELDYKFETNIAKDEDLEKLANLHLDSIRYAKKYRNREVWMKFLQYAKELCIVSNIVNNINDKDSKELITCLAFRIKENTYEEINKRRQKEKIKLECISEVKIKEKNRGCNVL